MSTIETELPKLKIYKNPVRTNEHIKILNTTGDEYFKLYNISGKEIPISSKKSNRFTMIVTSSLEKGFYLLWTPNKVFKILIN